MADNKTVSSLPGSTTKSTSAAESAAVKKYALTAEDCAEFLQSQPVASLDIYLISACNTSSFVKVPAGSQTSDGVSISMNFDGADQDSASPSSTYYRITDATADITFTIRLADVANAVRAMVIPGAIEPAGSLSKQTINKSILRRRPTPLIVVCVPEDEPPTPETVSGAIIFGNVSLDFSNAIDLAFNPNDPIEVAVSLKARYTKGNDGILGEFFF